MQYVEERDARLQRSRAYEREEGRKVSILKGIEGCARERNIVNELCRYQNRRPFVFEEGLKLLSQDHMWCIKISQVQ